MTHRTIDTLTRALLAVTGRMRIRQNEAPRVADAVALEFADRALADVAAGQMAAESAPVLLLGPGGQYTRAWPAQESTR